MNRRALFGIGGSALLPLPVLAQDGSIPVEWEERFEELEARVAAIEERLDALMAPETPEAEQQAERPAQASAGDVVLFTGSGTTLTEVVTMKAGPYRVQALVTVDTGFGDAFVVDVAGSDSWEDTLFLEYLDGDGEHEVSTNWTARRDGEYAFQIDCMSDWELTFEAM